MKLSDKIVKLRKMKGISQEELAEKLNVSRQAISRWEVGSAQPDSANILQLSKLFGVTADYLLNDDYESDYYVPDIRKTESAAKNRVKKVIALCVFTFGLFGNFIIYILSRFIEVRVPHITHENGEKWYHWRNDYSYKYFIQQHNLEFLTVIFCFFVVFALIVALVPEEKFKMVYDKVRRYKTQ